jgi:hypothetical protein
MEGEMSPRQIFFAALLLTAGSGAAALGQGVAGYDPDQFPAIQGRVAQYSLTPRGEVDGLILDDGTEVHLPPHLGAQLVAAVKPGDQVTVRGLKAREIAMVDAVSVTNDASRQSVVDSGPPGPPVTGQILQASGNVKVQLHGRRGELNGVLLEDGTIIRLPPDEAERLAAQLAVGQPLYVSGAGIASPLGKVIAAQQIGPSQSQVAQIQTPPPPRGPGRDRREPPPPR